MKLRWWERFVLTLYHSLLTVGRVLAYLGCVVLVTAGTLIVLSLVVAAVGY